MCCNFGENNDILNKVISFIGTTSGTCANGLSISVTEDMEENFSFAFYIMLTVGCITIYGLWASYNLT